MIKLAKTSSVSPRIGATHPATASATDLDDLHVLDSPRQNSPKTIRAREFLCVKHAIPKTSVSKVILYENTSQDRHLEMEMRRIQRREEMFRVTQELQRKKFIDGQENKRKKWQREDETRLNGMNLPHLATSSGNRVHSGLVMYTNPDYSLDLSPLHTSNHSPPLPPLLNIDKEKTEIVFHREKTFIAKLPQTVNINPKTLEHHLKFCGGGFITEGQSSRDERFQKLTSSLQISKHDKRQTWRPINVYGKGRWKANSEALKRVHGGQRKCSWCMQHERDLKRAANKHLEKSIVRSKTNILEYGIRSVDIGAKLCSTSITDMDEIWKPKGDDFESKKAIPGLKQLLPSAQ